MACNAPQLRPPPTPPVALGAGDERSQGRAGGRPLRTARFVIQICSMSSSAVKDVAAVAWASDGHGSFALWSME
ncbi:MAG: hypothetical protein ACKVH1_16700 [Alphaproteobacteria bacterium]